MNARVSLLLDEPKVDRLWRAFKEAHTLGAVTGSPADAVYAARAYGAVLSELNCLGEAARQAFLRRAQVGSV